MPSTFKRDHDGQGREVVEIGMNTPLFQGLAIALPAVFIAFVYYAMGSSPQGVPWYFAAFAVVLAAAGFAMVTWIGRGSRVRVTIDGNAGKLFILNSSGETELRMAEVTRAEFATTQDDEGSTLCRLEFVLKGGERVPATNGYSNLYAERHQNDAVKVINASLGRQML